MASILVPETAAVFGAIDSAGLVNGRPVSAHLLRVMNMSANRLLTMGHPLVTFAYNGQDWRGEASGQLKGLGWPFWVPITPGPITRPKMPGLDKAKVFIRINATAGSRLYIQVHTSAL